MEPITWFLTGMEKHSDEMREELRGNADHFMGTMSHLSLIHIQMCIRDRCRVKTENAEAVSESAEVLAGDFGAL